MADHPLIADHGPIGDLQTAALVSTGGSVDWLCLPRFDSPSIFATLLDAEDGGHFRIAPEDGEGCVIRQLYFPDAAILVTRFMSDEGVGELVDFMPPTLGTVATDRRRLDAIAEADEADEAGLMIDHAAWTELSGRSIGSATTGTGTRPASGRAAAATSPSPTAAR